MVFCFSLAQAGTHEYQVVIDLKNVVNDRVKVTLTPPQIEEVNILYVMPHMIPGVYSKAKYGKQIHDFKVFDRQGKPLKAKRIKKNAWRIPETRGMAKIEYWVSASWEKINFIFRPGGTNIEAGQNFLINHTGFVGYFEEYKYLPYTIDIIHPEHLYGSTILKAKKRTKERDQFEAPHYVALADQPIMYHPADTASHQVGDTKVSVAVYAANNQITAKDVNEAIRPLTEATAAFLGKLPVKNYQYLFYYTDDNKLVANMNKGALEHQQSSVYYLTERPFSKQQANSIRSIAAHEFLHILTPLHLHSEHIADYNFYRPTMSQHLWLYEGVTEYLSQLLLLEAELQKPSGFRWETNRKLNAALAYKPYSITEMSKEVINGKTVFGKLKKSNKYGDVYDRGALLAFFLDMRIRELSDGANNLLAVIQAMIQEEDGFRPFDDASFINVFVQRTYPELRDFFDRYVIGEEQLPYDDYLNRLGWNYLTPKTKVNRYAKGVSFTTNDAGNFVIHSIKKNTLGLQVGDELLQINQKPIAGVEDTYALFYAEADQKIEVTIQRGDQKLQLTSNETFTEKLKRGTLLRTNSSTPKQATLYRQFVDWSV